MHMSVLAILFHILLTGDSVLALPGLMSIDQYLHHPQILKLKRVDDLSGVRPAVSCRSSYFNQDLSRRKRLSFPQRIANGRLRQVSPQQHCRLDHNSCFLKGGQFSRKIHSGPYPSGQLDRISSNAVPLLTQIQRQREHPLYVTRSANIP
jgi:hypothetical protein